MLRLVHIPIDKASHACYSVVFNRSNMDYKLCTIEELADFVEESPCSRITQQLSHYRKQGHTVMVEKILEARKIVKRRNLTKALQDLC